VPRLILQFVVDLKDHDHEFPFGPHGAVFHRWVPDGPADGIKLDVGDPQATLTLWFERRGYVDKGSIKSTRTIALSSTGRSW